MHDSNDSVLNSIKHDIGCEPSEPHFDRQIIQHINSTLNRLFQMGLGEDAPYNINDVSDTWQSVFGEMPKLMPMVQEYVYLNVWRVFDPPTSGFVLEDLKQQIAELEWRIQAACDPTENNPLHPEVN